MIRSMKMEFSVDVELAIHDGDRLGQRMVVELEPHLDPVAVNGNTLSTGRPMAPLPSS